MLITLKGIILLIFQITNWILELPWSHRNKVKQLIPQISKSWFLQCRTAPEGFFRRRWNGSKNLTKSSCSQGSGFGQQRPGWMRTYTYFTVMGQNSNNMWGNKLLGRGLSAPSVFLVYLLSNCCVKHILLFSTSNVSLEVSDNNLFYNLPPASPAHFSPSFIVMSPPTVPPIST